jgi:hypothetical protein
MPPKQQEKKAKTYSLTSGEKAAAKKLKHKENIAKANPAVAAANKASSDAKRERRKAAGTSKTFA